MNNKQNRSQVVNNVPQEPKDEHYLSAKRLLEKECLTHVDKSDVTYHLHASFTNLGGKMGASNSVRYFHLLLWIKYYKLYMPLYEDEIKEITQYLKHLVLVEGWEVQNE